MLPVYLETKRISEVSCWKGQEKKDPGSISDHLFLLLEEMNIFGSGCSIPPKGINGCPNGAQMQGHNAILISESENSRCES